MFLTLVHSERTINTVQKYIYFFILSSIILIVLYMYDFCYFAFLFCFLIKSLKKKKSKSMLNNRKFMGIMFEFKVRNLVILVLYTLYRERTPYPRIIYLSDKTKRTKNEVSQHLFRRLKMKFLNSLHGIMN